MSFKPTLHIDLLEIQNLFAEGSYLKVIGIFLNPMYWEHPISFAWKSQKFRCNNFVSLIPTKGPVKLLQGWELYLCTTTGYQITVILIYSAWCPYVYTSVKFPALEVASYVSD